MGNVIEKGKSEQKNDFHARILIHVAKLNLTILNSVLSWSHTHALSKLCSKSTLIAKP